MDLGQFGHALRSFPAHIAEDRYLNAIVSGHLRTLNRTFSTFRPIRQGSSIFCRNARSKYTLFCATRLLGREEGNVKGKPAERQKQGPKEPQDKARGDKVKDGNLDYVTGGTLVADWTCRKCGYRNVNGTYCDG